MCKLPLLTRVGLLGLAALVGCWTSSSAPARRSAPETASESGGGASYGGARYGGSLGGGGGRGGGGSSSSSSSSSGGGGIGRSGSSSSGGSSSGGSSSGGSSSGGSSSGGSSSGGGSSGGSVGASVLLGPPSGQTTALDPAIIRRYIRRNITEIQRCYEQVLVKDPALAGTATIRFSIGGEGKVTQATGSGMPPVDACVASVISAIEFPKPQGGGIVNVSYPFIFNSAQSDALTP